MFALLGGIQPAAAQAAPSLGFHLGRLTTTTPAATTATFAAIAGIGYTHLELGTHEAVTLDAPGLRAALERSGLRVPSRHVRMPDLFSNWRMVLNECRALGCLYVVCAEVPPAERATLAGYRRVAELMNAAGKLARGAGLRLALHLHSDDLRSRDGVVPFEDLLRRLHPDLVAWQLDLAAAARAGRDPVALIGEHPDRFISLHLNDVGPAPGNAATALGTGRLDLVAIVTTAWQAGVRSYFVDDGAEDGKASYARAADLVTGAAARRP